MVRDDRRWSEMFGDGRQWSEMAGDGVWDSEGVEAVVVGKVEVKDEVEG